jgi:serine/threonine protein kinase
MEWVEGPTLARVRKRQLDPVLVLDGVLAGLSVLHSVGIGHCDVTPGRVVLRLRGGDMQAVLVDFGLAGRRLRPGCGAAAYLAPEVWDHGPGTEALLPMPVDIYAVGCLAFELVTGRPLFHAAREQAIADAHRQHDGTPPGLRELEKDPRAARLAHWITLCLAPDPAQRGTAMQLRKALRSL